MQQKRHKTFEEQNNLSNRREDEHRYWSHEKRTSRNDERFKRLVNESSFDFSIFSQWEHQALRSQKEECDVSLSTFLMNQIVWCRDQNAIENFWNFYAFDQNQHFRFSWWSQHDDCYWNADWCKYDENVQIDCERNCLHEMIKESLSRRKWINQRDVKIYFRRNNQRSHSTTFCLTRKNSHVWKIFS